MNNKMEQVERERLDREWLDLEKITNDARRRVGVPEILSCPFCGSTDITYADEYSRENNRLYSFVCCLNCAARGPVVGYISAYEAWNHRRAGNDSKRAD